MPLSATNILASRDLRVRYVTCCAEGPGMSDVERADDDALVFPCAGSFVKHLGPRESVLAEPSAALFFAAGRPHRVSHPSCSRDESLVLELEPGLLRSTLIELLQVDHMGARPLPVRATLNPVGSTVRDLFLWRLRNGLSDALEATETGLALLALAVRASRGETRFPRSRSDTRARRLDQVRAVQTLLLGEAGPSPSLSELARVAGTSPFHLARIFHERVGVPVHEYHLRLRLSRASRELLETDRGITDIALDHGFSSHSHFTHAFRTRSGTTPSGLRRLARRGTRREVSKIVTAVSTTDA